MMMKSEQNSFPSFASLNSATGNAEEMKMYKQRKLMIGIAWWVMLGTTLYLLLLDYQRSKILSVHTLTLGLLLFISLVLMRKVVATDRLIAKRINQKIDWVGSEQQFRSIVEITQEGIGIIDKDLKISFVNQKMAEMLDYPIEEMLGVSIFEFMDEEAVTQVQKNVERHLQGISEQFELRLRRKDGSSVWTALSSKPIFDEQGNYLGGMAMFSNITERITTEEALQESEESYRAIFNNARDLIYTLDLEGNFKTVNRAALQLTGYQLEEALTMNFAEVIAPEYLEMANKIMGMLLMGQSVPVYELEVVTKDGQRLRVEVNSQLIYRKGKPAELQGIARNVTERKRAELERQHLQEQLLQSQKMESVGRLAGGVAHDFNNLLTAIIGYGQLLMLQLSEEDSRYAEAAEIVKAGNSAASLTRQLLIFSRHQVLERKVINLNDTIGNLMKMLQRIIGEDVGVRLLTDANLSRVYSDHGWIEQVIINLSVNARDAMPEGGQLLIETHDVFLDEAYCKENLWAKPGRYAQISISDNGTGMDDETLQHIFEPFFTTKEPGKGTGLGLAVVFGIIQQHDGLIHVYSQLGEGTTFKIYLPAHELEIAEPESKPKASLSGGSETILIGEDDEMLQRFALTALEGLGYKVLLAHDGEDVIQQFKKHSEEINLLILDVIMPRMGGYQAYKRLRELNCKVPIIFVTGYSPEMTKSSFVPKKDAVIIQKPYGVTELGRRVREMLDGIQ